MHTRCIRRLLVVFVYVAVAPLQTSVAQPASESARRVDEVRFQGAIELTQAYLNSVIETSPGDVFDQLRLDADVTRLLRTGKLLAASADVLNEGGRTVVVFTISERPIIRDIRFLGNNKFKDKKLLEMIAVQVGDPADGFGVRDGIQTIEGAYADEGYGYVDVTYDEPLLRDTGELVYTIEEGPRVRVREIQFEGNDSFPRRKLNQQIQTKTYLWIFRDGKYDETLVEEDAASLENFYRSEGFLDAKASYRVEPGDKPDGLRVVFVVAEGTRYRIHDVAIAGNEVFSTQELSEPLRAVVDDFVKADNLERDARDMRDRYRNQGYIYAGVEVETTFLETPNLVDVRFDVNEGEQYRVGRVVVRGNQNTKDKVVRRALDLHPPNELIDYSKIEEAEKRLRETQIFGFARVTPVGDEPGVRDLVIDVEEQDRVADFIFGVGVNSNSGVVGNVVLDIKNFDLYDWPRNFAEFIKGRSFRGAGQQLRLELQPGTEVNRFRIDFVEPYFLDHPIRFSNSYYYFQRGRERHDEERLGATVGFGKRLTQGWFKDWYAEIRLRAENVTIDDLEFWTARDVRDVEGDNFLTSVRGRLVRDRTDSVFVPSTGDVLRLSWEQFGILGGDDFFGKVQGSYTWHTTVHTDREERKHVVSVRGDLGGIFGDSPTFERFYGGGIGSIRGFEFRGVSPRRGLKDDPVGGDFMALARAEYSFPLVGETLRGVLFSDMGTVEKDFALTDWRVSVGAGVRMTLDIFGPVPMEFDLAIPVLRGEGDEEQAFSFFIGATF